MSQQIDNQIVKMQFDNASFEKNAAQSMSTLDKLKQALKFDKVNMTPLEKAFSETEATATKAGFHIQDVWQKMSSIIEQEVAQKIVDAGKKVFNALTLEGVSDGFKEYELKMGSIQTIMNGTGESLATVNRYLDELNKYSDQTIYSFSDMTQNIGKFTNAGVKLEDAVAAIKGIANEAAISGANANEASRAMYNFAQALSAGYVKLIDWKSIENANMATKGFKEALLEMAVAMGNAEKTADGMYRILTENNKGGTMDDLVSGTKNFNDSLQYQWMTTEVLTKTLKLYATDVRTLTEAQKEAYEAELKALGLSDEQIKKFEELGIKATDAASEIKTFSMLMDTLKEAIGSGWAMTWQILIGDFEQAKELWTEVGKVLGGAIDTMSDARNAFLTESLTTGWEKFISIEGKAIPQSEKFRDILVDLGVANGKLKQAQADEIESTSDLIKSFHELEWVTGDLLVESVEDYYNILKSMSEEELGEFGVSTMELAALEDLNKGLHDGSINADEFAEKMKKLGGRENILAGLKNLFNSLLDVLKPIGEAFDTVFEPLNPDKLYDMTERFRKFTEELKVSEDAANTIRTAFTLAFGGIKTIINGTVTAVKGLSKLVLPLLNLFDSVFGLIGKIASSLTGSKGALEVANKFTKIGDKIGDKYLGAMQKLADFINKVANAIRNLPESTVFTKIHDGVENAITSLQRFWKAFKELPVVQQMIKDFNDTVASIEAKVTPVVQAVEKAFGDLKTKVGSYLNMQTLNNVLTTVYNKVKDFIKLVKDFAERIKKFFDSLKEGKSIVQSFKDSFGDIIDKVKELKDNLFGFFEDLFSKGDELGQKFDLEKIQQAIHEFVTNITPEQITMIAVASTFMLIALNLLRLSEAMKNAIDAFTGIGTALKNVINSYVKKQKSTILQIAESIVIVAAALWVLSTVPKDKLENATSALITLTICLGALTVALTACGVAMHAFGGQKSMVELASGLALVAGSFMIITASLKALEYVNLEGILPKLLTVSVVLAALVGLSVIMGKLDKFSKGSLTMVACSAALLLVAESLNRIGEIPTDKLDKSMDAMLKMMLGLAAITIASGQVGVFSAVGLIAVVLTLDKILPMIEKIVNYDYTTIQEGLTKNEEVLKKVGIVVGAMVAIGALAGNRLKGAGVAMLSIAATFGVLVGVAKLASMLKPSELRQGEQFILTMGAMIAALELCSSKSRLGMFGGKNGGEGSKFFINIAITMGILLGIAKLASMMSAADIAKGELACLGLVALVGAMVVVAKHAQKAEGVIKSVATMLFAISLILAEVAVLSIIPLGNMLPALGAILSIIAALGFLALSISKNTKIFDKAQFKATGAGTLIAAMLMVAALGIIMWQLAQQSPKNVMTAAVAMAGIVAAVALLTKALGSINGGLSAAQLQTVFGAVFMVGAAAVAVGGLSAFISTLKIDPNTMIKAAASISAVLLAITPTLLILSTFSKNHYDYKAMGVAISGAIGALVAVTGSLLLLSNFGNSESLIQSAESLAIALVAICVPIAVIGAVGAFVQTVDVKSMVAVVGGAIVALAGVTAAILTLSNYGNSDTIIQSAQALAIGLLAISVPIAVLGAVGLLCSHIGGGGIAAMAVSAVLAVAALQSVAQILVLFSKNIDEASLKLLNDSIPILATAIGGIAVLALAISAAGALSGGNFAIVLAGGLAMVEAIGVFLLIVAAIAGLGAVLNQDIIPIKDALMTGLEYLVIIAGKIGEAAGALVSGFAVGLTDGLPAIADNLVKFSEKMVPFSENMKKVNQAAVTGCKNLATAMLYICASSFIEGLTRWLGLGTPKFDFAPLGKAVAAFCEEIKNIPKDAVAKASTCSTIALRLSEITSNLDATGGVAGWLLGDKDLSAFADAVKKLGFAIKSFCDQVKDLPGNAVQMAQTAADAAVPMVDLSKTLTGSGGILQKIIGEKNLGEFGTNLTSFASSLKGFVEKLVEINGVASNYPELIRTCADATTPMVDLANGIRNSGGKLAEWLGENTLDVFGQTLIPFANDLRIFVARIGAMAQENPNFVDLIAQSVAATKQLIELANGLENMGGALAIFSGDNTLSKFGETLPPFGNSLSAYARALAQTDLALVVAANDCIKTLINLGNFASTVPETAFKGLKTALEDASKMPVSAMVKEITTSTPLLIAAVTTMFTQVVAIVIGRTSTDQPTYYKYGQQLVFGIRSGIQRNYESIIPVLNTMITRIKTYLNVNMASRVFEIYGKNIVEGIKTGIRTTYESIIPVLAAMITRIKSYLNTEMAETVFEIYGKNIVNGIKNGIEADKHNIIDALSNLINEIHTKLGNEFTENNFKGYGENVSKGIKSGINEYANDVKDAAYNCGMNAAKGLKNGIDDYADEAVAAAEEMARRVAAAMPKTLKEQSPSKLTYQYGMYYDLGFINGVVDYAGDAVNAVTDMGQGIVSAANKVINAISMALDADLDMNPTIRPVLDTSDITEKAKNIGKLFDSEDLALAYKASGSIKQQAIEKADARSAAYELDDGEDEQKSQPTQVTMIQNNYSPKALNRYEIYRNTKNQISQLKGALG